MCPSEVPSEETAAISIVFSSPFQPFMFNTLNVRQLAGSKRKLSFKNVSNVVMQLLHSIKYSIDVPFANMAMVGQCSNTNLTLPQTSDSPFNKKVRLV